MCYRLKMCHNKPGGREWLDTSFGMKSIVYHFLSIEKMDGISCKTLFWWAGQSYQKLNSSSTSQIFERNEGQFVQAHVFLSISNLFPSCKCLAKISRFSHGFDSFVNSSILWLLYAFQTWEKHGIWVIDSMRNLALPFKSGEEIFEIVWWRYDLLRWWWILEFNSTI